MALDKDVLGLIVARIEFVVVEFPNLTCIYTSLLDVLSQYAIVPIIIGRFNIVYLEFKLIENEELSVVPLRGVYDRRFPNDSGILRVAPCKLKLTIDFAALIVATFVELVFGNCQLIVDKSGPDVNT